MTPMAGSQQDATSRNLRVLIVGSDRTLEEEFRNALAGLPDRHAVIHFAESYQGAADAARRGQPAFVLIEIDRAAHEVAGLARDLQEVLPAAAIAATFTQDALDRGHSESATLIELLRAQVRDFIRRPVSATELRAVFDRLFARQAAPAGAHGRVASFISNKGGVGKSTLAVNVACGLALRHPDEVLLIDTSLQVGTCAFMLDLKPVTSIIDAVRERDRLDRTLLRHLALRHDSGLRVLAAPPDALEAAEVDDEAVARIVNMARHSFKYVVVDTFPLLDSVLMTVLDVSDIAYVLMQGTAPAVAATARLLPTLEKLGVPTARQRLVLNYNYKPFVGNLRPGDIADRLQRTIDHVVSYDPRVLVSMNTGSPQILHTRRWHAFGRAINAVIDEIGQAAANGAGGEAPADNGRRLKHVPAQAPGVWSE